MVLADLREAKAAASLEPAEIAFGGPFIARGLPGQVPGWGPEKWRNRTSTFETAFGFGDGLVIFPGWWPRLEDGTIDVGSVTKNQFFLGVFTVLPFKNLWISTFLGSCQGCNLIYPLLMVLFIPLRVGLPLMLQLQDHRTGNWVVYGTAKDTVIG